LSEGLATHHVRRDGFEILYPRVHHEQIYVAAKNRDAPFNSFDLRRGYVDSGERNRMSSIAQMRRARAARILNIYARYMLFYIADITYVER